MNDTQINPKPAGMTLAEIDDEIEFLQEHLGEVETQHKSETALFGDSWPGAQVQIQKLRNRLAELEADPRVKDRGEKLAREYRAAAEGKPYDPDVVLDDISF